MLIKRVKNWMMDVCQYCIYNDRFKIDPPIVTPHEEILNENDNVEKFIANNLDIFEIESKRQVEKFARELKDYNVNEKDEHGNTALHHAIYEEMDFLIEPLVKNGADPNIMNDEGITPLMLAGSVNISRPILTMYLDGNANSNLQDKHGQTAIWKAAYECCIMSVMSLIMTEADVNIRDETGATPLIALCKNMKITARRDALSTPKDVAEYLVKAGVDLFAMDKYGRTALDYAMKYGADDMIEYLQRVMCEYTPYAHKK